MLLKIKREEGIKVSLRTRLFKELSVGEFYFFRVLINGLCLMAQWLH